MFFQIFRAAFAFTCLCLTVERCNAEFIFKIGQGSPQVVPTFVAGGSGSLPVSVFSTEADTGRTLQGYNLGFDFDLPGVGVNPLFSNFAVSGPGNAGLLIRTDGDNFDFEMSASGLSILLDEFDGPTDTADLFTLTFDISPAAPTDSHIFEFVNPATVTPPSLPFSLSINQTTGPQANGGTSGPIEFLGQGGQFNIVAVPEPSSLLVLCAVSVAGLTSRRKRFRPANESICGCC